MLERQDQGEVSAPIRPNAPLQETLPTESYAVAKGRALVCDSKVLGPGHELHPSKFPGGLGGLERLIKRGAVVRVPRPAHR